MKRLWIFVLAGPLIGFIGSLFSGYGGLLATPYILVVLVMFYVAAAIPALLLCVVDYLLADKLNVFKRAAAISVLGCAFGIFLAAYFSDYVGIPEMAIAGGVAGLICSLLSDEKQNGKAQERAIRHTIEL